MKTILATIIILTSKLIFSQIATFKHISDDPNHCWRFNKHHNGTIKTEGNALVFHSMIPKGTSIGTVNMLPTGMNVDFTKDFEFHARMKINTSLPWLLLNASSDGIDAIKINLSSFEIEVTQWKNDKPKRLLKKKVKMKNFRNYNEFEIELKKTGDICSIKLKQNGNEQNIGSFKFIAEPNYTYAGFSYNVSGQDRVLTIQDLTINYTPYTPQGIEILEMDVNKEYMTNVNSTKHANLNPYITPDGQTLYFVIAEEKYDQVYFSQKQSDNSWSSPQEAPHPLNIPDAQSTVVGVSADNSTFYVKGSSKLGASSRIALIRKEGDEFSTPERLNMPIDQSTGKLTSNFISQDGSIIISSMELKGGKGKNDLYVYLKDKRGGFGSPINLGGVINTRENEGTPFLAPDNRTLYFNSSGHPGYGETDIFMSKRLDDTWTNWSKPVNLGPSINTPGWDGYFTLAADGEYAYYVSADNCFNMESIYSIKLKPEAKPEPVILISGDVFNNKTKKGIDAKVTYTNLNNPDQQQQVQTQDKHYTAVLPEPTIYAVYASAEGFYPISDTVSLIDLKSFKNLRKNLYLEPIEKNVAIRLNNIYFEINKHELLTLSYDELDRLVELMQNQPNMKIHVGGHTDNTGGDELNVTLSDNRANAVRNYLLQKGIDEARVSAKGYGKNKPLNDNSSEELRQYNRRVEFTVIE